jgi:hypothetical protein
MKKSANVSYQLSLGSIDLSELNKYIVVVGL